MSWRVGEASKWGAAGERGVGWFTLSSKERGWEEDAGGGWWFSMCVAEATRRGVAGEVGVGWCMSTSVERVREEETGRG